MILILPLLAFAVVAPLIGGGAESRPSFPRG